MKKTFAHHKPSKEAIDRITILREAFSHLYELIETNCPVGYERSVALIELQTVSMWAIKSIVCNDPKSTVDM